MRKAWPRPGWFVAVGFVVALCCATEGPAQQRGLPSPIGLHYRQGKMAVERGLHVQFNKTMTTTVEEADDLIALAEAEGVRLVASPGEMLRPLHREVRRLVSGGDKRLIDVAFPLKQVSLDSVHEKNLRHSGIFYTWYTWRPPYGS